MLQEWVLVAWEKTSTKKVFLDSKVCISNNKESGNSVLWKILLDDLQSSCG